MIAILGSRKDDLLYLSEFAEEIGEVQTLPCGGEYRLAKICGVEVLLGAVGHSNYLSAIYLSQLFSLYAIPHVIKIGDSVGIDANLELGDIVLVDAVYPHAVNYHADGFRYGEIPGGIPSVFPCDGSVFGMLTAHCVPFKKGHLMSGEKAIYEKGEFEGIMKRRFLYLDSMGVYNPCSYGLALTSYLHQAAFTDIEIVSFLMGDEEGKLNMKKVALQKQVEVGRIVTSLLEGGLL